jgi:hypothetical protein
MNTPRITSAPNLEDTDCANCGELLPADGGTVLIVDPDGWGSITCSIDCADEEAYALADLNPDTDWRGGMTRC